LSVAVTEVICQLRTIAIVAVTGCRAYLSSMEERMKAMVIELLRSGASKDMILDKTGVDPSSLNAIMAHFTRGTYDNDNSKGNGAQHRKQKIRTKLKRESRRHLDKICPPDMRKTISEIASSAKTRARERGLEFEEELSRLAVELYGVQGGRCALTGKAFDLQKIGAGQAKRPYAPSLDRIDSTSGYTGDNIRLVCQVVNFALNSYGEDVFTEIVNTASKFDKTDLTSLPTTEWKSQIGTSIVREEERELKQSYINHVIIEAPKILAEHGGSLEKSEMREALRKRFPGKLPLGEGNAYGWGFRKLTETSIIEPASRSNIYVLKDRKPHRG
jgi:hypothetical protein